MFFCLLVPPPRPNIRQRFSRKTVFKSLASLHEVKIVYTLHKLPKTSSGFGFDVPPPAPPLFLTSLFRSEFQKSSDGFRFLVRCETYQVSHCSEMMRWKWRFAASVFFWLSWASVGCTALLVFHSSPDFFLHPITKHGGTEKKKKHRWFYTTATELCLAFSWAALFHQPIVYSWLKPCHIG